MRFRDMLAAWRDRRGQRAAEEASADDDAADFLNSIRGPEDRPAGSVPPRRETGRHRKPAESRQRAVVVEEMEPVAAPAPGRRPPGHISGVPSLADLVAAAGPPPEPEQPRDPTVITDSVRPAIAGDLMPYLDGLPGYGGKD